MGEIFFLVACQYDREDEELLNANLASWIHLPAGTDAGKVERWGAHDRTCWEADYVE